MSSSLQKTILRISRLLLIRRTPPDGNQRLAAPPGGSGTGAEDNVDDSWMGNPCRVEKDAQDPQTDA